LHFSFVVHTVFRVAQRTNQGMESAMRRWHAGDPPNDLERAMNDIVFSEVQGAMMALENGL
jgi:hypothetical protein